MSTQIKLYPFAPSEDAELTVYAGSVAAGYPVTRAGDFNPRTITKNATGGDTWGIKLDLAVASGSQTVEGLCVFLKNPSGEAGRYISFQYSDNGSSWSTPAKSIALAGTEPQLFLQDLTDSGWTDFQDRRYYAMTYSVGVSQVEEVGIFAATGRYVLSRGFQRPDQSGQQFYNRILKGDGGQVHVSPARRQPVEILPRRYVLETQAMIDTVKNAHLDSRGRLLPLVIQEGTAQSDLRLVRFASDKLIPNAIGGNYWNPVVTFEQVPYIAEGDQF